MRRLTILVLLGIALSNLVASCSKEQDATPPTSRFFELSQNDASRLNKQRAVVEGEARRRYGTPSLTKTKSDLTVLQRLLDDRAFSKAQAYELQCLGVAFGDVLTSELSLRWVIVTDEFGTDPTLRFKDTTIQLNALTMIAKRVEDDVSVNVSDLFVASGKMIADLEKDADKEKGLQK